MDNARRCTPREDPRGISMLGVGFARRGDHQAQSGPAKNPFLHVATVNGAKAQRLRSGYLVTRSGVFVGLTAANTQGGFAYVKLARAEDDWAATPVCISVNAVTPAACGTLLMDTGVTAMYLTVPATQAPDAMLTSNGRSQTLIDGTKLTISIPTEASPQALYSFTVGDSGNPLAPSALNLVSRVRPPFVNTSVHFLNGFDYLYDADGGFVGFRWTGRAAPAIGKVTPSRELRMSSCPGRAKRDPGHERAKSRLAHEPLAVVVSRCQTAQCCSFPRRVVAPGLVLFFAFAFAFASVGKPTGLGASGRRDSNNSVPPKRGGWSADRRTLSFGRACEARRPAR